MKKLQVKKTLNVGTRTVSIVKQSLNKTNTREKPPTPEKNKKEDSHVNKAYIEIVKSGEYIKWADVEEQEYLYTMSMSILKH